MKKSVHEIMEDSIYETMNAGGIKGLDRHEEIVRLDAELTKIATLTSHFALFGHISEEHAMRIVDKVAIAKKKLAGI